MPRVNKNKCIGCGACVASCPNGAINLVNGKAVIDAKKCKNSRECISVCPQEAIN